MIRKPYRAALAGCGRVGFLLERDSLRPKPCTHAGGISAHPDFRLVAGCDINPDRLADFGRTYGIAPDHLYSDAGEMLKKERLDLLCVATWTASHDEIVRGACRAKVSAVVCEKPMSVTWPRAKSMESLARRSGTLLLINHGRRWSPEYRAVRRAILDNRYGKLMHIQGCVLTSFGQQRAEPSPSGAVLSWHSVLDQSGGGPLLHDGTHLLDIVFYLTGLRPLWVEGRVRRHEGSAIEHHAVGRMSFKERPDLEFCFEAGGARNYFHFEVELWFESGRITVGNGIRAAETSIQSTRYSGFRDLSPDPEFQWEPYRATSEQVEMEELSAWFSRKVSPQNSAGEAILSQETIFAFYESAVRGRRIFFPYRPPPRLRHPLMSKGSAA